MGLRHADLCGRGQVRDGPKLLPTQWQVLRSRVPTYWTERGVLPLV